MSGVPRGRGGVPRVSVPVPASPGAPPVLRHRWEPQPVLGSCGGPAGPSPALGGLQPRWWRRARGFGVLGCSPGAVGAGFRGSSAGGPGREAVMEMQGKVKALFSLPERVPWGGGAGRKLRSSEPGGAQPGLETRARCGAPNPSGIRHRACDLGLSVAHKPPYLRSRVNKLPGCLEGSVQSM